MNINDKINRLKYEYSKATTIIEKQRIRRQISQLQAEKQKEEKNK